MPHFIKKFIHINFRFLPPFTTNIFVAIFIFLFDSVGDLLHPHLLQEVDTGPLLLGRLGLLSPGQVGQQSEREDVGVTLSTWKWSMLLPSEHLCYRPW